MSTAQTPSANAGQAQYDLSVFVGRFQPFHNGHLQVVRAALKQSDRLLVVVGSAGAARRPDTLPFTAEERREMILACLPEAERARVSVRFCEDFANMTLWTEAVQGLTDEVVASHGLDERARIALAGCSKDRSSYYLKAFPRWDAIDVPQYGDLSATPIRTAYFGNDAEAVSAYLAGPARAETPEPVVAILERFRDTEAYRNLVEEWAFVKRYRSAWEAAPYPPIFVTADAVVVQAANILLIQRKSAPGKGLWALPGGFVEQDERVVDAAVRELAEETRLATPVAELQAGIRATRVFDDPFRSSRGRTITHATLFHLQSAPGQGLPAIEAADDARQARWWPMERVRRDMMFEDHYQIIQIMKGLLADTE